MLSDLSTAGYAFFYSGVQGDKKIVNCIKLPTMESGEQHMQFCMCFQLENNAMLCFIAGAVWRFMQAAISAMPEELGTTGTDGDAIMPDILRCPDRLEFSLQVNSYPIDEGDIRRKLAHIICCSDSDVACLDDLTEFEGLLTNVTTDVCLDLQQQAPKLAAIPEEHRI
jgi:hypothetical protein